MLIKKYVLSHCNVCEQPLAHLDDTQKRIHMLAHGILEGDDKRLAQYLQLVESPEEAPVNPSPQSPMDRAWGVLKPAEKVNLSPKVNLSSWNPFKAGMDSLQMIQGKDLPWEDEENTI